MREKELTGTFGWRLTARNKNDTATFKTREGRVGGYREHFDVKLLQMMEQQMKAISTDGIWISGGRFEETCN
jgi:hypothetical protein